MTNVEGMWSVDLKTRKVVQCASARDWPSDDARLPNQCSTIWRDWVVVVGGGPHPVSVAASVPSRMSEKVHVFSISERRWLVPSPISPMHEARMSASVVPLSDTHLMVCGGVTVVGGVPSECKTVEVFDLKTGSWSYAPPMQTARACSGVSYWKGRVYVVGGSARPCSSMKKVVPSAEVYDIKTRTWSDIASPTVARSRLTLIATNHGLYALGGSTSVDQGVGVRDTSLVEVYHPEFDLWQTAKWELAVDGAFVGFEAGPWMIGYHPAARRLTFRRVDMPSKCPVVHLPGIPRQTWCTVVPIYD